MSKKSFWGKNKSLIVTGGILLIFTIIYVAMNISYNNYANRVEVTAENKEQACQVDYDAMWKIIQQQAGVVDKYEEAFKEIYSDLINGRYSDGDGRGQLMSWIHEHNPNFDPGLFSKLMNTIESLRIDFATRQKELIAIQEEYNKSLVTFPGSHFIGDREKMKVTIITSSKTKEIYDTGEENDIDIF